MTFENIMNEILNNIWFEKIFQEEISYFNVPLQNERIKYMEKVLNGNEEDKECGDEEESSESEKESI